MPNKLIKKTYDKGYSIKARSAYLFAAKISAFIINFTIPIVLVRTISMEDFGLYKLLLMVSALLIPTIKFGVAQSLFYFYPIEILKNDVRQLLSQTLYYFVLSGSTVAILFYYFQADIAGLFFNKNIIGLLWLAPLYAIFSAISSLLEIILILEKRPKQVFFFIFLTEIIESILVLCVLLKYQNIELILISKIVMSVIKSILLFVYVQIKYSILINVKHWRKDLIYDHVKYIAPIGSSMVLRSIKNHSVKIILSIYFTTTQFAIFSIALIKIPLFTAFINALASVTKQEIAIMGAKGKHEKSRLIWHKQISKFMSVSLPIVFYLFILAEPVITLLYTDQYRESADIFQILLIMPIIQSMSAGTIFLSYNMTRIALHSVILAGLIGVPFAYLLTLEFGLKGAAMSIVLLYFIEVFYQLLKTKNILVLRLSELMPWKNIIQIVFFNFFSICLLIFVNSIDFNKVTTIIIGAIIYFIPLFYFYHKYEVINFMQIIREMK